MRRSLFSATIALAAASALPAQFSFQPVVQNVNGALYLTHAPDDSDRMFVVQQAGQIRVMRDDQLLPTPFLDVSSRVVSGGERGLLGLAFPPDYDRSGLFYISYTRSGDGQSVLERYSVSANDPDIADPNSGQIVYGPVPQPFRNHNGGCIQFGPDGFLYLGLGDGGSGGDPSCNAQNGSTPLGKLLRLDVSTTPASAPASNPFVGQAGMLDEIWALGLRNPWRFTFDRDTGDLWIADVGQNNVEEVDFQPASSNGGENYGWKIMEGDTCFSTLNCAPGTPSCNDPSLTMPVHTYTHSQGQSITGGYVYRGCAIPSLQGTYWFGDFASGRIWTIELVGGQATNLTERTSQVGVQSNLASFGEDAQGELYAVTLSGTISRLEATTTTANDLGFGTVGGNGAVPQCSVCGLLVQGESAEFRLDQAAPNAMAALLVGSTNNPTNMPPFGTVVPNPWDHSFPQTTDGAGRIRFTLPGGGGAATAYIQYAIADPGGPGGVALSNALEVFFR